MRQRTSLMRLAIAAAQAPHERTTAESWVMFCLKAADEAYAVVMENPPDDDPRGGSRAGSAYRYLEELKRELKGEEYVEPKREKLQGKELIEVAHGAAAEAFRACMPHVTGRLKAQAYIACVAAGVQRRYINGAEARALLYTSQLALSAARKSRAK